jgi:hypothetical protein
MYEFCWIVVKIKGRHELKCHKFQSTGFGPTVFVMNQLVQMVM